MRHLSVVVAAVVVVALFTPATATDIFVLQNGGQVRGEWVNKEDTSRKTYVIRTSQGGEVTLDRSQVKQVIPLNAAQLEYEEMAPRVADTVEAQWKLAEWCREHSLRSERQAHLERIVELDPNHKEARAALGYSFTDGRWVRPEQLMEERGYVRYQGRWVLPQEVEILEQKRKNELAEKAWFAKLKRFRDLAASNDLGKSSQGREGIVAINDPYAVPALSDYFNRENSRAIKLLFVEALAKVGTHNAYGVLATHAIEEADVEVRMACLDQLAGKQQPDVIAYFVSGLKSKDNERVNRCGYALSRMKDASAVPALINALVTTQKVTLPGPPPGQIGAGFSPTSGSVGLGLGGGPRVVTQQAPNRDVLTALVELTGQNFNYDVQSWRTWLAAQQKKPGTIDARRDKGK